MRILKSSYFRKTFLKDNTLQLNEITTFPVELRVLRSLATLGKLAFPLVAEHLFWVASLMDMIRGKIRTPHFLCGNKEAEVDESPDEKLARAFAKVWRTIMKNHTIIVRGLKIATTVVCTNGKLENLKGDRIQTPHFAATLRSNLFTSRTPYRFPVMLPVPLHNLRFIGCGKKGEQAFSIHELVIAYEWPVWLMIVLSILAISWMSSYFMARKSEGDGCSHFRWKYLLSVAQILMEQGDGFSKDFFKLPPLRFALGPFLLMSIILSEGYRNENVYNLVLPGKFIPYKVFEELVQDKFSIFAATYHVILRFNKLLVESEDNIEPHSVIQNVGRYLQIIAASEVEHIVNASEEMRLHSRLHPNVSSIRT